MDNFDAKLCEEVQKYPHLYDSSLKEYRDSVRCQNSWQEIAQNLNINIDAAKKKWKYIRECYVKSKKSAKGKSGDGRSGKPNKYFEMLAWLSPFIKHRATESNMPFETDSMQLDEPVNIIEEEFSPPGSVRSISPAPSASSSTKISHEQRITRKRPRTEVESAILQSLKEKDEEDEFTNFGKIVADTIRKLPRMSQIFVKKKINDILFDAEIEATRNPHIDPQRARNEESLESIRLTDFLNS